MSTVTGRLVSGIGAGGAALVAAVQLGLLVPVLLAVAVLGGLPLLLIAALSLVAVYSPDPARRTAAEKTLDRLLGKPCLNGCTPPRSPPSSSTNGSNTR